MDKKEATSDELWLQVALISVIIISVNKMIILMCNSVWLHMRATLNTVSAILSPLEE